MAWIALNHCKGVKIPLVISGDTHHYSRYEGDDGMTQFITSGGGGEFLHPTHQLADTVDVARAEDGITWMRGKVKKLTLASTKDDKGKTQEACYPTRPESLKMLVGNFLFPIYNPAFALLLGVMYWLLGLVVLGLPFDSKYIVPVVLWFGFWTYTKKQEGEGKKVLLVSVANGVIHAVAIFVLVCIFEQLNRALCDLSAYPRINLIVFALEMIVVGGAVAAELFGIYLYVSSRWLDLNHNDAFSSMRRDSHRHFLRMRICDEEITVFPIGIDHVPRRDEWKENTENEGSPAPVYVPEQQFEPRLIDKPIRIQVERQQVASAATAS